MLKSARKGLSLKWGLLVIMALCWIIPVAVIFLFSNYSISSNVQARIRDTITASADTAFQQTCDKIGSAMDASRVSSYGNTIRSAYDKYNNDSDGVVLYDTVTTYLLQQYGYDSSFKATFLFFTSDPDNVYFANNRTEPGEARSLQNYKTDVHKRILNIYPSLSTGVAFITSGQDLYMVRNIVDSNFNPYAVIVMDCNETALYASIRSIVWLKDAAFSINDITRQVVGKGDSRSGEKDGVWYNSSNDNYTIQETARISGNVLKLNVVSDSARLMNQFPDLRNTLFLIGLSVIPLLLFVIWAYYHYISRPVDVLVDATGHMEAGERGYVVEKIPGSREFRYLTERFNSMSTQLKIQFEQSYEEQLQLQDARMRALRSQINPHFLNNTLEVILWAARMAKDEKVCGMIEALSTMLDAATARGGNARGTMEQELVYADAYLHILSERLGDRLTVTRKIKPETLKVLVPCLILQPIVENAIEHGIALRQKGELVLRGIIQGDALVLEVENDGEITATDKENIEKLLSSIDGDNKGAEDNSHIGIRNVNRRLKILYGEEGGLTITEVSPGKILARIVIPHVEFDTK